MNINLSVIKETIRLAEICAAAERKEASPTCSDYLSYTPTAHATESYAAYSALTKYMLTLDYNSLLDIETIMLLGRDSDYDKSDSSEVRFTSLRDFMKVSNPSRDDEVAMVYYMADKDPLGQYLRDGLSVIGIEI